MSEDVQEVDVEEDDFFDSSDEFSDGFNFEDGEDVDGDDNDVDDDDNGDNGDNDGYEEDNDEDEEEEDDENGDENGNEENEEDEEISELTKRLNEKKEAKAQRQQLEIKRRRELDGFIEQQKVLDIDESNQVLSELGFEEMPDLKVKVGDEELSLKEIAEDNPEITALMKYFTSAMTSKANSNFQKKISGNIGQIQFWNHVNSYYPGARRVAESDGFNKWADKQSEEVQGMIDSGDPQDAVVILGEYKKAILKSRKAKNKNGEERNSLSSMRKKKSGLRGGKTRSSSSKRRKKGGSFSDGFDMA